MSHQHELLLVNPAQVSRCINLQSAHIDLEPQFWPAEEPDVDFLEWLSTTVAQAAKSAEEHEVLCATSESLTASIESQFKLSHVVVSCNSALLAGTVTPKCVNVHMISTFA